MLILGIETSCDETGVALYDQDQRRLLAHAVHSQVAMHEAYGGVVPELASRDHIRRLVPLTRRVLAQADRKTEALQGVGYTEGPGLAGALLVGASFAHGLSLALRIPAIGIHHHGGAEVPGLGPARVKVLLAHFGSVARLKKAGVAEIAEVRGVGPSLAAAIVARLGTATSPPEEQRTDE